MTKYYFIYLKDGQKLKTPVEKTTEEKIKEHFGDSLESVEIGVVSETVEDIENKENERVGMYWKVRLSYNDEAENVIIPKSDLLKVQWAFVRQANVVLRTASFRGKDIISIMPDYVMSMGWNRDYEPSPQDWLEIQNNPKMKEMRDYTNDVLLICENSKDIEQAKKLLSEREEQKRLLAEKLLLK